MTERLHEILLWDGPILLTYESDKGKRGVFVLVSGRFGGWEGVQMGPIVCLDAEEIG